MRPLFRTHIPSMLKYIGFGLLLVIIGYILLEAAGIWGVVLSNDEHRYVTCAELPSQPFFPDFYVKWYWKLVPFILYGIGRTIVMVVFYQFLIAQSPEKMKGFTFGMVIAIQGTVYLIIVISSHKAFTLCFDVLLILLLIVLFAIFLILSKCYTLRERNREINIQAIVEEHYERYMDQEEEYEREHGEFISDSDSVYSDNDSDID